MNIVIYSNDTHYFLMGNDYYQKKDYSNALASYNAITQQNCASLCNMGNCHFYLENYPQALAYWLRAQSFATISEYDHIENNKKLLFEKIDKKNDQSLMQSIASFFNKIASCSSLLFLQILFLLIFCIAIGYSSIKTKKIISQSILYLSTLFLAILLVMHYTNSTTIGGIVIETKTMLFAGPHKDFQTIGSITCTDYITIQEKRDDWYKVKYKDVVGWIQSESIQII